MYIIFREQSYINFVKSIYARRIAKTILCHEFVGIKYLECSNHGITEWNIRLKLGAYCGFFFGFVNYKKGCTRLAAASDKVYQLLAHGRWLSLGTLASSTTKTGHHNIAEILLKVALSTKNPEWMSVIMEMHVITKSTNLHVYSSFPTLITRRWCN
jgi:hypothetical protein